MKQVPTNLKSLIFSLAFSFSICISYAQTTLVSFGSSWKYLDNNTRPSNWETSGFNDASWNSGNGELGYGDGDETTVVNAGCTPVASCTSKFITTYFRKAITIANPSAFTDFTLNVKRDDGIVVYINGIERYSNNMPAGRLHSTLASSAISGADESTPQTATLSTSYFSAGTNVIAVEIHQNSSSSSDITFDLELLGNVAPVGLINYGDSWKYLDNNTRPSNWETPGFNDAAWATGASELGYGDGGEATIVSYGPDANNKYTTTYFRKTFNITGLNTYNDFTLNVVRDDGVVVYVNGMEAGRDNMPGGTPTHSTFASSAIGGAGETTPVSFSLSPCSFVEGSNTIAVEIHQSDLTSSDVSFNLELIGNVGGGTPTLSRGPYLQIGNETAITIRWRTSSACYGRVSVGPSNGTYTTATVDETCPTTEHIIRVTGLTADTKYYYQISATDGTIFQGASDNFFTTLPLSNTTRKIKVVAFGDCGRGDVSRQDDNLNNYINYLSTNGIDAPDAWLLLGDNAYSVGSDAEYTSNFFNIYGSTILKNHKLYPAPGNHDYGNSSANKTSRTMPYHLNFSVPENGECGGVASNKQNYYSYDVGNIHFLSLDSYGIESDGTSMETSGGSALKTWLDADLAANTKKWVIAYWHHPPYTKSSHNSDTEGDLINIRQNFITFLENHGVDLIINGHAHAYERGYLLKNFTGSWTSFNPATHAVSTSSATYTSNATCPYVYNTTPANHGTVYVVEGSTGATGGTNTGFGANAMPYAINDGGVFYFEVEDNRLDAKMLRRNGTIFDQFTIMKDVNQTTNYSIPNGSSQLLTASWPKTGNYSWTNTAGTTRSVSVTPPNNSTTNYSVTDDYGCVTDQFSITTSGILPVSILSYDAYLQDKKVIVKWSTAVESNNDYFTIERSANGIDFTAIGTVDGAGNSSSLRSYTYTDQYPLLGRSFYRLSQTNFDGQTEYVGVKRIDNNDIRTFDVKTLSGYSGKLVLQINTSENGRYSIRVYDMSGRKWGDEFVNISAGITRKEINLSPGMYIWEVKNGKGEAMLQKVLIQ
ncbi:MAG TPA: metallophosphoesterase [Chitinophagaceae bacterium]|nr:metallophosphoesterase [Chitinophagaceae bacterium]